MRDLLRNPRHIDTVSFIVGSWAQVRMTNEAKEGGQDWQNARSSVPKLPYHWIIVIPIRF